MPDETILCWTWPDELKRLLSSPDEKRHVTKKDCVDWLDEGDAGRHKLAEFFRQRMKERYIDPVTGMGSDAKNGFPIMAISCLLIETYESFRQGWESTEGAGRSPLAFCYFFDREQQFHSFKGHGQQFYKHVRCGILHQGETTGGWSIRRENALFDPQQRKINATEFHRVLAGIVDKYSDELRHDRLPPDTWAKFNAKIRAILKNCEAKS